MVMRSRITICLPTYNRRQYLGITLGTLLAQTMKEFRLHICDDGSSDGTREFLASIHDPRVVVLPHSGHLGWPGIINRLLTSAQTELVVICHDHDLYEPSFLEKAVNLLDRYASATFVFTACHWIDEREDIIATHVPMSQELVPSHQLLHRLIMYSDCPVCASSVVIRRTALEQVGLFDPEFGFSGDLDLYIRLALIGDAAFISEPMVRVRAWTSAERSTKANWQYVVNNRAIRLRACDRLFPGRSLKGTVWRARLRLLYDYVILIKSLSLWSRGECRGLQEASENLGLPAVHPLRPWFAALARFSEFGAHAGRIRRRLLGKV